jgi:hypothetical protein
VLDTWPMRMLSNALPSCLHSQRLMRITDDSPAHLVLLTVVQNAKIFGDGVWFRTNAAALTDEGANILGFGFGFGNNLPCEYRPCCVAVRLYTVVLSCRSEYISKHNACLQVPPYPDQRTTKHTVPCVRACFTMLPQVL